MSNNRYLGQLFVSVLSGEFILDSYSSFRRRSSHASLYRKAVCGADIVKCGGADPCGKKADPYVTVSFQNGGGVVYGVGRTHSIIANHSPQWGTQLTTVVDTHVGMEEEAFFKETTTPSLIFKLYDDDGGGNYLYADDFLGESTLPLEDITSVTGDIFRLPIKHPKDRHAEKSKGRLVVKVRWRDFLAQGSGIPNLYFKRSKGNSITLYHDAHCHHGHFSTVALGGRLAGSAFNSENCWEDIHNGICAAKHLILMAGWSVNTAIKLKRLVACESIGELLLRKANEGVTVVVMVWDDVTSMGAMNITKDGLMGTYDEYTREFFNDTKVHCVVAKRYAGDDNNHMFGPMLAPLKSSSFTHHQKIVVCDFVPLGSNCSSLLCFVGGLDLTSGRYDTSEHRLYSTLKGEHTEDYYNGCIVGGNGTGEFPREPWHDIHAQVRGPGAWDVYSTFMERLDKHNTSVWQTVRSSVDHLLVTGVLLDDSHVFVNPKTCDYTWNVQVFRSLDSESANMLNKKYCSNFNNPKGLVTDKSIQGAYLYQISESKRFIYIENQYFLGSSHYWLEDSHEQCAHLIPYALAKRICKAIREGTDFCVFVIIPYYPEGIPTSAAVQDILNSQYQTMRMMYHMIGKQLSSCKHPGHPTDFLQFFFPAQRELHDPTNTVKRFHIYVHSKMMIVDDEYIIIGSANINERSMNGGRDTEIAVGLCQEYLTSTRQKEQWTTPLGDIAGFRMQLWEEFFGQINKAFYDPGSMECRRITREYGGDNWLHWINPSSPDNMPHGYACTYPHYCSPQGDLKPSEQYPFIADTTGAWCKGVKSKMLPLTLTT